MASRVYLVLFIFLHACSARPITIHDKETVTQLEQLSIKDLMASVANKFTTRGTNVVHKDKDRQKSPSVQEAENIEDKKVKIPYAWKLLQQATEAEIMKREERSILESTQSSAEENLSSKSNDPMEDVVVMDYAQPHRKPPIHNKGT
ncbi:hypothetical protein ABFS82_01G091600 [Erythranthe guttata]|uniref:uncharacterized protein LOC105963386 n=1 Tax=Erythranthe guttata TaxID=4155 RepID=UPI00064D9AD1|nr:PREDICTED: uncharacterized protein LOC105963386 [Erythranthe guttata]|eukprot:XP_012843236.1 PREDICTED: uncharacterized protein LOC105963386 [Erythranthe guttata]